MIEIPIIREAVEAVLEIIPYPYFVEQMREWHGIEVKPVPGAFTEKRTHVNDSYDHACAEMALIWAQDAMRYEFLILPFIATTRGLERKAMRSAEKVAQRAIVYAKDIKRKLEQKAR